MNTYLKRSDINQKVCLPIRQAGLPGRQGFTPLVEDGLVPKAFSLRKSFSNFNMLISKPLPTNIRHKNARPSFTTGFTLVETLVAISILLMAVVVPMTATTKSIAVTSYARDQVVASYLAQDAMEYVINKKKLNLISGEPDWLNGFRGDNHCLNPVGKKECVVDTRINTPGDYGVGCNGVNSCLPLQYNSTLGIYGYGSGADWVNTKFTRSVSMVEIVNDVETQVEVTVTWKSNVFTKSFTIRTNIYNTPL